MLCTCEDEGLNKNGPKRKIVMYVCTDEGLSKSKEIRKAYEEEKPNCGRERVAGLSSSVRWLIYKSGGAAG